MTEEYGSNSLPFRLITLPTLIFAVLAVLVVMVQMDMFFKVLLLVSGTVAFVWYTSIRIDHHLSMEQSINQP